MYIFYRWPIQQPLSFISICISHSCLFRHSFESVSFWTTSKAAVHMPLILNYEKLNHKLESHCCTWCFSLNSHWKKLRNCWKCLYAFSLHLVQGSGPTSSILQVTQRTCVTSNQLRRNSATKQKAPNTQTLLMRTISYSSLNGCQDFNKVFKTRAHTPNSIALNALNSAISLFHFYITVKTILASAIFFHNGLKFKKCGTTLPAQVHSNELSTRCNCNLKLSQRNIHCKIQKQR